ncbi:MAG: YcaO-like family protein [bacterium]
MASNTEKWSLKASPKYAAYGVERVMPPEKTVRAARSKLKDIGIQKEKDLLRVDTDGIPVFIMAARAEGASDVIYYKGKGATKAASKASVMMEAVERVCAKEWDGPVFYCDYESIKKKGAAVDPRDIYCRPDASCFDKEMEWVEGYELVSGTPVFAPLNCVIHPYSRQPEFFFSGSIGLASGNTYEEAICHGMCEAIEHDSMTIARTFLELAPRLYKKSAGGKESGTVEQPPDRDMFPRISLEGLPQRAAETVARLRAEELLIYLRNITTDIGVPAAYCVIVRKNRTGSCFYYDGSGAHPDARIAVTRALNEAAQSRSVLEWILNKHPEKYRQKAHFIDPDREFGSGDIIGFPEIKSYIYDSIDRDIRFMFRKMKTVGLDRVITFDLTKPDLHIPVVRILIPKLELWASMKAGRKVLGDRARSVLWKYRDGFRTQ